MQNDPDTSTKLPERDFLVGRLLIAMPNLSEGCFKESVVLMCAHTETHAMGLIINKVISDLTLPQILGELKIAMSPMSTNHDVFFGGPVETKSGVVLHSLDYRSRNTILVTPTIGLTATKDILKSLAGNDPQTPPPNKALFCLGHAGWSPGQLEHELARNAWLECEATEALIFDEPRKNVWDAALHSLGINSWMFSSAWSSTRDKNAPLN